MNDGFCQTLAGEDFALTLDSAPAGRGKPPLAGAFKQTPVGARSDAPTRSKVA